MELALPIVGTVEEDAWSRITDEVNAWRGACIQCFAQAEVAIAETLVCLHGVPSKGPTVRLRHLIGQRLEDLDHAIGPNGAFYVEGRGAWTALQAFRKHEPLRNNLAHGVARIAIERNGGWVVVFRHISLRSHGAERHTHAVDEGDARAVLQDLRRMTNRLVSLLGNLRRALEVEDSPCATAAGPIGGPR